MTSAEPINQSPEEISQPQNINPDIPTITADAQDLNPVLQPESVDQGHEEQQIISEQSHKADETLPSSPIEVAVTQEIPSPPVVIQITPPFRRKEKPQKQKLSEEEFAPIWDELTNCKDAETIITVKCVRSIRGGALVEYKGLDGFIPMSHFDLAKNTSEKHVEPLVGQNMDAVVIELSSRDEQRFVCSRKTALKKEKFDSLKKGMILEGTVTSITNYGVFVDLGGIDGLVHISRLSKIRVNHPSDVVKPKQHVKVSIVDVDYKKERIALSMKEFAESPWVHVNEKYPTGSVHKGKVRNITSFGVYVQLEPGVDGMVHISDLTWTKRLNTPEEILKIGQEVETKVLEVNGEKQRIALSIKDLQPDPWPRLANIYPVGTESEAKIKQLTQAGCVIELPFDVDAFVPRGKMGLPKRREKGDKKESPFSVGDAVRVHVVDIDVDQRSMICSIIREEHGGTQQTDKHKEDVKQSAGDRAFTFGELSGLKEILANAKKTETEIEGSKEIVPVEQSVMIAEEKVESVEIVSRPTEPFPSVEEIDLSVVVADEVIQPMETAAEHFVTQEIEPEAGAVMPEITTTIDSSVATESVTEEQDVVTEKIIQPIETVAESFVTQEIEPETSVVMPEITTTISSSVASESATEEHDVVTQEIIQPIETVAESFITQEIEPETSAVMPEITTTISSSVATESATEEKDNESPDTVIKKKQSRRRKKT